MGVAAADIGLKSLSKACEDIRAKVFPTKLGFSGENGVFILKGRSLVTLAHDYSLRFLKCSMYLLYRPVYRTPVDCVEFSS